MTEREKLLSREYYKSRDSELLEMYHRAKQNAGDRQPCPVNQEYIMTLFPTHINQAIFLSHDPYFFVKHSDV